MSSERAQKEILEAVTSLAKYEMEVWNKVGPAVQIELIDSLTALAPEQRVRDRAVIIAVCEAALSPEVEGTTWNADSVTWHTGAVPAIPEIVKIREKAISFLFELFKAAKNDTERRELLSALQHAGHTGGRTETKDDLLNLTLSNATQIVEFLFNEAESLSYELMATIEHNYWFDYRRAREISLSKARVNCQDAAKRLMAAIEKLRDKFNADSTFVKFKVLVGFESIFPQQWTELEDNKAYDYNALERYRADEAAKYVASINDQNEKEWFALIERIASIQSNDMATFPPFANFLMKLAQAKPQTVARLLSHPESKVTNFFPAILQGLQESGDEKAYNDQVEQILKDGKHLGALARHLRFSKTYETELAERTLRRAIEVEHDVAVGECLIMAMEAKSENAPSKEQFFVPAIEYLNRKKQFWWVRAVWIASESAAFFASLSEKQSGLLIPAIVAAPRIEHQAEQILIQIAKHYPSLVWECFAARLRNKREESERYEAIPYQFHGLEKELSKDARLAVEFGRKLFKEDPRLFRFRGGRLLSDAFPHCPPNFAEELAKLAAEGTEEDIKFILAVMENYHGEETTHEVLKRIVTRFPDNKGFRSSVVVSLEGTGVLMGEFGYANALREKLEIARKWLADPRPEIRAFAEDHIRSLELQIADEMRRAEERKALHELEYGKDDEAKE